MAETKKKSAAKKAAAKKPAAKKSSAKKSAAKNAPQVNRSRAKPDGTQTQRPVSEVQGDEQVQRGMAQVASPEEQAKELEEAQRVHAQRTGGGEVREGELQAQRDEHNRRTNGES